MQEPLIAIVDRELTPEDLVDLAKPRGSKAPALVRLSARHHRLARCLAEGMSPGEAGLACNYVSSRVSILLDDPTFKELVDHYRAIVNEKFFGLQERLAELAEDASELLADRMQTNPDQFENVELMKLVALGADRTGHGPSSTHNHNVTVGLAERLDRARERARALPLQIVEEAEVVNVDKE